MTTHNAGFLGFGHAVPDAVRTNDFWAERFARGAEERKRKDFSMPPELPADAPDAALKNLQLKAMRPYWGDPFRGTRQRRVAAPGQRSSALEVAASRQALERAGLHPRQLDLIIVWSLPPDEFIPSNAGLVQHALGATRANIMGVESGCASFLSAVEIGAAMIRSGAVRHVLVVCSALHSQVLDFDDPASVNFGDGAGAAVLGPVPEGEGLLASAFRSYGDLHPSICVGPVQPGPWYAGQGRLVVHSRNLEMGRQIVMGTTEYAAEAMGAVLDRARLHREAVTHYYSHQPVVWFNAATRAASGLEHAHTTESFTELGGMSAANIPVNMSLAQESGQLKKGDVAVLYACGAGFLWAAMVVRWSAN